ncbi:MAG: hypothetical protein ACK41E_00540 [Deinococcales bacterium]
MRSALDCYGTALLHLDGNTGGKRDVLCLCPLERAQPALEILQQTSFKGWVTLAVLPETHSTPVLALVAEVKPTVVVALDATELLSSGEGFVQDHQKATATTGLVYEYGGEFPAWQSQLLQAKHGLSILAAIAASAHKAVLACSVRELPEVFALLNNTCTEVQNQISAV